MFGQKAKDTNADPSWKYWTAIIFSSWIAGFISFSRSSSAIIDGVSSFDTQAGAVAGSGLAVGIVVWLICYFSVIRASSKTTKWLAFISILGVAIVGAILGSGL